MVLPSRTQLSNVQIQGNWTVQFYKETETELIVRELTEARGGDRSRQDALRTHLQACLSYMKTTESSAGSTAPSPPPD